VHGDHVSHEEIRISIWHVRQYGYRYDTYVSTDIDMIEWYDTYVNTNHITVPSPLLFCPYKPKEQNHSSYDTVLLTHTRIYIM
jgi:hypothetical protein